MSGRLRALADTVRTGFWAIPTACVAAAVALALVLVQVDRSTTSEFRVAFGAGPDGAREVLSAISTSMITFTGLVFTITIVVLQLTSSQFSPRVLRTFLRDRLSQVSLGVFVATFVYAVTVLRTVSSVEDSTFVPAIATTVGVVLLFVSVAMFVGYIHHIATSIQVSSILTAIGEETRRALDVRYPAGGAAEPVHALRPDGPAAALVPARRSGVVTQVDDRALVRLAAEADVVLRLQLRPGDFVPEGAPVVEVLGDPAGLDTGAVSRAVILSKDRTMQQDVAFGFRQLVDIGERALSPGVNDPTTAVQALDQLHDLLRRLATRPLRNGLHTDDDGRLRLVTPAETFESYVELALGEIEQYGRDSTQVRERLAALKADVAAAAVPQHRGVLERRPPVVAEGSAPVG